MNERIIHDVSYSLLSRASRDHLVVGTTKLIKLLYLIDCDYFRWNRKTLTEAPWIFFHYGPYAEELVQEVHRTPGIEALSLAEFDERKFFRGYQVKEWRRDPIEAASFSVRGMVDAVYRRWAGADLELLLDHVYFETAPMLHATRFRPLDFSLIPDPKRDSPAEQPKNFSALIPADQRDALRAKLRASVERRSMIRKPLRVPVDDAASAALNKMGERD